MVTTLCVPVMVRLAQCLPVLALPEENHVASMRDRMVNHNGRLDPTFSLAHHTEWMLHQVDAACLVPCRGVAALTCGCPRVAHWLQ